MKKIFNLMLCSAFLLSIQNNFWSKSATKQQANNTYKYHERNYKRKLQANSADSSDQQSQELNAITYDASVGRAKGGTVVGIGNEIVTTDSMKNEIKKSDKKKAEAERQAAQKAEESRINQLKQQREDAVHQNHITGFQNISNAVSEHMNKARENDASYSSKYTGSAQLDTARGELNDSLRQAFKVAVENITSYANASAVMNAAGGSDENGAHSKTILTQKSPSSGSDIECHLLNLQMIENSMKNYELSEEELKSLQLRHEQEISFIKEAAINYWKNNGGEGGLWNIAKDDIYFDHATFEEEYSKHMEENPASTDHLALHEENMTQHILASKQNAKVTTNKTE